jgi:nucleoside-diphosphate-sugar epimerase
MTIGITGGAGFVGGHLTRQLRTLGHRVTVFTRPTAPRGVLSAEDLVGLDVLIHAAWDFNVVDNRNVADSIRLFEAARAAGMARVVFISTMSAFDGCRSRYGASKLAVERHAAAMGVCPVRLGFVCADSNGGLSGSLKKLAALPIVPLPGGGSQNLYTLDANDLAPAFLKIIEHYPAEPVNMAYPEPVRLDRLLRCFAQQQGRNPFLVPFPWRMLWLPLRAVEAAGIHLKFRSDNLVSLMNQNPAPDFRHLREWGFQPKMIAC